MSALATSYLGETYLGGNGHTSEPSRLPLGLTGLVDSALGEFVAKQGDTGPAWKDVLSYSNGALANLSGCTVRFIVRNLSATTPVKLTGVVEVPSPLAGGVLYRPSAKDTSLAGEYMANWIVTYPTGEQMTFPTEGYREIRIEASLLGESQQIVSLGEVKKYLYLPDNDRIHDAQLISHIEAVGPLLEEYTGPLIPRQYDELYDGGNNIIELQHAPVYGYGSSPILELIGVSEFRGPIEYPLAIVRNPVYGSIYSVELNPRDGTITRRTAGGGTIQFMPGRNSVHAVYMAGQEKIPPNVKMAALEAIRVNFRTTQAVGRGRETVADGEESGPSLGFFLPHRCKDLLQPMRRHPSLA